MTPSLLRAASSMGMTVTDPGPGGVCVVTCKTCGEIHGGVNAARYEADPHPCARCHRDDWRSIGEIAAGIAARAAR